MMNNDDELLMLQKRIQQQRMQDALANPQESSARDATRSLFAGFTDALAARDNGYAQANAALTGGKPTVGATYGGQSEKVQQILAQEAAQRRQKALDGYELIDRLAEQKRAKDERDASVKRDAAMKGYSIGEDGATTMIPGGAAELALQKAKAEVESIPLDRNLKRQLTQAQIDNLTGKTDLAKAKAAAGTANKDFKKDQIDAATYARRMEQSSNIFDSLEANGYDRASAGQAFEARLPEMFQNERLRSQDQAERNFVNSLLRRESGAAISKEEFTSAEAQYFPRPGDTDAVKRQKLANRQQVMGGMLAAAGAAIDAVPYVNPLASSQASTAPVALDDEDIAAINWARANPSNPKAKQILQLHGGL